MGDSQRLGCRNLYTLICVPPSYSHNKMSLCCLGQIILYFLNFSSVITPKILYEISELESIVNEMKNSPEGANSFYLTPHDTTVKKGLS